jgi:hypothetical protein
MGSRPLRSPSPHERLMLIAVIALAGRTEGIHCCLPLLQRHLPHAELLDRLRPCSSSRSHCLLFEGGVGLLDRRAPVRGPNCYCRCCFRSVCLLSSVSTAFTHPVPVAGRPFRRSMVGALVCVMADEVVTDILLRSNPSC